ncbi:MAG TPA: hypothetical protein VLF43_01750, partial [Candidatus Saccharimonadales bacterium]|nr:hypothetical protein [Candidatus Saccharimonadales bacterium]
SLLLSRGLYSLPLAPLPHPLLLVLPAVVAVQIAVTLALIIGLGLMRAGQNDTFTKLLLGWPLTPYARWFACTLPCLLLGTLAVLLVCWPLGIVLHKLGMPTLALIPACITGFVTAFGLVQGVPPGARWLLPVWISSVIWVEYMLLGHITNETLPLTTRQLYAVALATIFVTLIYLCVLSSGYIGRLVTNTGHNRPVRLRLAPHLWFMAKFLRRPNIGVSFAVAWIISTLLAIAAHRQHVAAPDVLVLFSALIGASLTTELRATTRKYDPAEITALKGTYSFVSTYVVYAVAAGTLAILPLVVTLSVLPYSWTVATALQAVLHIATGLLAGAFAGSLLAPKGRDISGQCAASVIVLAVLFGLPQLHLFQQLAILGQCILYAMVCTALIGGVYCAEYKRNSYQWRKS